MKNSSSNRSAFTLIELLMVMMIIALLASITVVALASAMEEGRKTRARAQIAKIDALIMDKWNSYRLRKLPLRFPAGTDPRTVAFQQLVGMRELQKMEMPDRITDITESPVTLGPNGPAIWQYYRRTVSDAFATHPIGLNYLNEQAECLYLILSQMREGNSSAVNGFLSSEIGDTDDDGLKEILDPWGTPIRFLRWAPGYSLNVPDWTQAPYSLPPAHVPYFPVTTQATVRPLPDGTAPAPEHPDPFDPLKVDPRWKPSAMLDNFWVTNAIIDYKMAKPFALKPLVFSAGPDRSFDVCCGFYNPDASPSFQYSGTGFDDPGDFPNDPYYVHIANNGMTSGNPLPWIGACHDIDEDGRFGFADNITNHDLSLSGQ